MKVLVTLQPAWSHVHAAMPFVFALQERGHEVRVASAPGTCRVLEGWGVSTLAVGPDWDVAQVEDFLPGFLGARNAGQLRALAGLAAGTFRDLSAACASWQPDLVLRDASEFAGLLLARQLSVPVVVVGITLAPPQSWLVQTVGRRLLSQSRLVGVDLEQGDLETALAGDLMLSPYPPSFGWAATGHPHQLNVRPSAFAGRDSLRRVAFEPADVYATLGTVHNKSSGLLATILRALDGAGLRVIATTGTDVDPATLGTFSDRIQIEQYVPQQHVMSSVSAVVSHAGFGTVMAALTAGLPLSCIPLSMDHPATAATCLGLGLGTVITGDSTATGLPVADPDRVTEEQVVGAVLPLLVNPEFRDRASVVAAEIASLPDPYQVCGVLEELAS